MKIKNLFWKSSWFLGFLFSIFTLLNAIFYPGLIRNKSNLLLNNVYIFAIAGIILVFLYSLFSFNQKIQRIICAILIISQVFIQLYLAFTFGGAQGVDDFDIRTQAEALSQGSHQWPSYFSFAPNNVGSTIIFSWIIKLCSILKFKSTTTALNLFTFLIIDIAAVCGYFILKNKQTKILYILLCCSFAPLFLPALILYTDPLAMSLTFISIFLVTKAERSKNKGNTTVLLICSIITMCLATFCKTNAIIILIAFAIYTTFKNHSLKKTFCILLLTLVVFSCCNYFYQQTQKNYNFEINSSSNFPYAYWIAMGLDSRTDGLSSKNNINLWAETAKYKTLPARVSYDNKKIRREIQSEGLLGLASLWARKENIQWSMGSMGTESRNYNIYRSSSKLYKYIFGQQNIVLLSISQAIYLILWLGFFIYCLEKIKRHKNSFTIDNLMLLFIIGIFLFHLLMWETMERFAYMVVLPFLLLSSLGIKDLFVFIQNSRFFKDSRNINISFIVLIGILCCGFALDISKVKNNVVSDVPVLGQHFYRKTTLAVNPQQTLSEHLHVPSTFNKITLVMPSTNPQALKITLKNDGNDKKLIEGENFWKESAGDYILKIKNKSSEVIKIQTGKSQKMDLLQQPIKKSKNRFFDITFSNSSLSPLLSVKRYIQLFTLCLLITIFSYLRLLKITKLKDRD